MTEEPFRPDDRGLWWCKLRDGRIIEHWATDYEGHSGHVRCVPVGSPA